MQQNAFSLARETRSEPFVGCARRALIVMLRVASNGVSTLCTVALR